MTSCTPRILIMPPFPPSIFQCHLLGTHSLLCLSSSRPSSSTLQQPEPVILVISCTPPIPTIPYFPPSIFRCRSPGACSLLCLSRCASHLHVPIAPRCKRPGSYIHVMFCTPHVSLIPSISPSSFRKHACRARIWLGLLRQQYIAKQTKSPLVSYIECLYNTEQNLPNLL